MTDPILPADLRELMKIADRRRCPRDDDPGERARANLTLESWRVWLPALLDRVEALPQPALPIAGMSQAGTEARGLV